MVYNNNVQSVLHEEFTGFGTANKLNNYTVRLNRILTVVTKIATRRTVKYQLKRMSSGLVYNKHVKCTANTSWKRSSGHKEQMISAISKLHHYLYGLHVYLVHKLCYQAACHSNRIQPLSTQVEIML